MGQFSPCRNSRNVFSGLGFQALDSVEGKLRGLF